MNNRHINFDLCDILTKLPTGEYCTYEMKFSAREPWQDPKPLPNAPPWRIKFCPVCHKNLPIAEFVMENAPLRTAYSYVVATIREWCKSCDQIQMPKQVEEVTTIAGD